MEFLSKKLTDLLKQESIEWKKIHMPFKFKLWLNADNIVVVVDLDSSSLKRQMRQILSETVKSEKDIEEKVLAYLHWARRN